MNIAYVSNVYTSLPPIKTRNNLDSFYNQNKQSIFESR